MLVFILDFFSICSRTISAFNWITGVFSIVNLHTSIICTDLAYLTASTVLSLPSDFDWFHVFGDKMKPLTCNSQIFCSPQHAYVWLFTLLSVYRYLGALQNSFGSQCKKLTCICTIGISNENKDNEILHRQTILQLLFIWFCFLLALLG